MTVTAINEAAAAYLKQAAPAEPSPSVITAAPNEELGRLLNLHLSGQRVGADEYALASERLGLSKRQIQRKLALLRHDAPLPHRPRFELTRPGTLGQGDGEGKDLLPERRLVRGVQRPQEQLLCVGIARAPFEQHGQLDVGVASGPGE
jgi:hypothetical protein